VRGQPPGLRGGAVREVEVPQELRDGDGLSPPADGRARGEPHADGADLRGRPPGRGHGPGLPPGPDEHEHRAGDARLPEAHQREAERGPDATGGAGEGRERDPGLNAINTGWGRATETLSFSPGG